MDLLGREITLSAQPKQRRKIMKYTFVKTTKSIAIMNGNTKEIELKDLTLDLAKKVVEESNKKTPELNLKVVEITTTVMELDDHEETEREEYLDRWSSKIAAFIAAEVIMGQESNNYCVKAHEITEHFNEIDPEWVKDKELISEIESKLYAYPQFEGDGETVIIYDEEDGEDELTFDCVAWTNHIACDYDAD